MSPIGEEDVNFWAVLKAFAAYALPFLPPSIAGASMGLLLQDRRKRDGKHWLNLSVWSVGAGTLLTPLFVYMLGAPESVGTSAACFVAMIGAEAVDFIRAVMRRKAGGGE